MIIYFDGGCRPNPGQMTFAIVTDDGYEQFEIGGEGTNNLAEWHACLQAAAYANLKGETSVTLRGDSTLIVNQAKGEWQIKKPEMQEMKSILDRLIEGMHVRFEYVPRRDNLAGQLIERKYAEGF